jgi:hypothetical protein
LTEFTATFEEHAAKMNVSTINLKEKCLAPYRIYTGYVTSSKTLRDKNVTLHTHYVPYIACSGANKLPPLNRTEQISQESLEKIPNLEEKLELASSTAPATEKEKEKDKIMENIPIYTGIKHDDL